MNLDIITAPVLPDSLEWRVQSQTKDGKKIIVVPYLTNRSVMECMDLAFGPMGWKSEFVEVKDGFLCTLSVKDDSGEWISRMDGAPRTDIEGLKGGVSGAMKRCAVQFGLGRSLYNYPRVMIETTDKYLPDWAMGLLDKMVEKINTGAKMPNMVILKVEHSKR